MAEMGDFRNGSFSAANASGTSSKAVPMKFFSTWEVEKSAPSCIPRICCLTLTRLQVLKPLDPDMQSIIIAMKMQSSKQVLRSSEIVVPANGLLDTQLDLSFSLQYPHFLKHDGNRLQVMLQRRKKYKNRVLSYKTLAAGHINMSQADNQDVLEWLSLHQTPEELTVRHLNMAIVLQKAVDQELCLYSDVKEMSNLVALIMVVALSSQPIDQDVRRPDRSPGELSDDDDVGDFRDSSSNNENSDVDPVPGDDEWSARFRKLRSVRPAMALREQQRNLKQKFVALLRRFKITDEVFDESVPELGDGSASKCYVDDLFDEVENLSDSDFDIDTMSIHSTPKPKLTPFFASRQGGSRPKLADVPKPSSSQGSDKPVAEESSPAKTDFEHNSADGSVTNGTEPVVKSLAAKSQLTTKNRSERKLSSPSPMSKHRRFSRQSGAASRERKHSFDLLDVKRKRLQNRRSSAGSIETAQPRRLLMDQLSAIFSTSATMPDSILLINNQEWQSQMVAQALQNAGYRTISTCSLVDVRATISAVVSRIQKHTSKSQVTAAPIKIAVIGGDSYISAVMRPYVELFSSKSPDWLNYIRFLIIPFGLSTVAKNLARLDSRYNSLFNDSFWKDTVIEKLDSLSRFDVAEVASRIVRYLSGANLLVQLPLAEAVVTNKDRGFDESSQIVVPFIADVRLGPVDAWNSSTLPYFSDSEELSSVPASISGSPPHTGFLSSADKGRDPSASHSAILSGSAPSGSLSFSSFMSHAAAAQASTSDVTASDSMDLQLEYWVAGPRVEQTVEKVDRSFRKDVRCSLKTGFRSIRVFRNRQPIALGNQSGSAAESQQPNNSLSMVVITREKKQKIMRLKKPKEPDTNKSQQIDGISRLICTSKAPNGSLAVSIDGVDWPAVKFFQLSTQWQTQVKHFPILIFGGEAATASG